MDLGTLKLYEKRCRELKSYFEKNTATGDYQEYYSMFDNYNYFKDIMSYDSFKAVLRHKRSRRLKRYRANKKMTKLVDYGLNKGIFKDRLVFTTLTLNNDALYLKNGKQKQMRTITKKIDKYINENYDYAIINVDYGEKNDRIHFHLIGLLKEGQEIVKNGKKSKKGFPMYDLKNNTYNLGYSDLEIIDIDDNRKITNYLLKINNHSNKPSTKNHRIRVLGNKKLIQDVAEYAIWLEKLIQK